MKAPQINDLTIATIAAKAFIALPLGPSAGAQAAPSGIGSAVDSVSELEENGFEVVLTKMGTGQLDHCTVDSVRQGERVTRLVQSDSELVNQIVYQTAYLTVKC